MTTQINEFQLSNEGVSKWSEGAYEWSKESERSKASVGKRVKWSAAEQVSGVSGARELT